LGRLLHHHHPLHRRSRLHRLPRHILPRRSLPRRVLLLLRQPQLLIY
jgi:hypothetical protein